MNSRRVSSSEGEREYITEIGGGEVPSQGDLEVIRAMRRKFACFGFTENIGVIMVLFRDFREVGSFVKDRSRFCGKGRVG